MLQRILVFVIWLAVWTIAIPGLLAQQEPSKSPAANNKAGTILKDVLVLRDLEYSRPGDISLLLDLYRPEKFDKALPLVVWVHGGGWNQGSKDRCPAVWLTEHGFAVASINYRLTGQAHWPAQIDDCRAAIRWLRTNAGQYGLDAAHVGVWGGSAGEHLVALLGTLDLPKEEAVSSRVQTVCDWYGPADLLTMPANTLGPGKTDADLVESNGAQLLGGIVRDLPELAKQASALHQVSAGDAPFLIMHGDADPQVPLDQSQRLHDRLVAAGVPSMLHIVKSGSHGGAAFQTPEVRQIVREFFQTQLKL